MFDNYSLFAWESLWLLSGWLMWQHVEVRPEWHMPACMHLQSHGSDAVDVKHG